MLTIRPLSQSPSERDTCIRWANAEWGEVAGFSLEDWSAEYQRIDDHPTDEVFIAFEGDSAAGMVWMLEHEGLESHMHLTPWLSCLVVDPVYRDKGVARALMAHLESYVAAGGDEVVYLLTETPAVYFTHGWEVRDTAALGDKDVFVMEKHLATKSGIQAKA